MGQPTILRIVGRLPQYKNLFPNNYFGKCFDDSGLLLYGLARAIRFRAECRLGDMMAAQRDAGQMAKAPQNKPGQKGFQPRGGGGPDANPTLAAAGIDKNLAKAARLTPAP